MVLSEYTQVIPADTDQIVWSCAMIEFGSRPLGLEIGNMGQQELSFLSHHSLPVI